MSFANKHNVRVNPFTYETPKTHQYAKPADLVRVNGLDAIYALNAIYVNKKGMYGDEPVLVTNNELVNAPSSMMDTINGILSDSESINLINDGEVGFKFYEYTNKYGKQYGVTWVDNK